MRQMKWRGHRRSTGHELHTQERELPLWTWVHAMQLPKEVERREQERQARLAASKPLRITLADRLAQMPETERRLMERIRGGSLAEI